MKLKACCRLFRHCLSRIHMQQHYYLNTYLHIYLSRITYHLNAIFWQKVATVWRAACQELQVNFLKQRYRRSMHFSLVTTSKCWIRQGSFPPLPVSGHLTKGIRAPGWRPRVLCLWPLCLRLSLGSTEPPFSRERRREL